MRRIISALLLSISSTWAMAQATPPLELAPDAPDRYIVVPGDTLWGISAKFLKDPYRWPQIWRMNPEEIKNPHRIYPGQVVILDRSGTEPQLKLGRLIKAEPKIYAEEQRREIPAIPQNIIEPFLSEPLVVEEGTLDAAPQLVATQESRVYVGAGGTIYARNIPKPAAKLWQAFRPGAVFKDPDTGEVLGYEAYYLGSARVVTEGEPTLLEVLTAKQEIGRGDRLMPASRPDVLSYVPHAPTANIKGRVLTIYGGVGEAGKYSIVTLSRGKKDGVEFGHVLALYRAGPEVVNRFQNDQPETTKLPDERYGLVFVFRVFDRVSYALVMEGARPVAPGDVIQTP